MSLPEALAVLAAGLAAGTINAIVGSGTLITFPVLLAVGYGPVVANVSNTVGLAPGSISGAIGYRAELTGQGRRVARLSLASLAGGITGAILLLELPASAFEAIVPALIGLALILVVLQPRLSAVIAGRRSRERPHGGAGLLAGIYGTGVYGGYFGAAQGVILLAVLGIALEDDLQRVNALKNVLAALVNTVAAVIFVVVAEVAWPAVALLAAGSTAGGLLGAKIGRRLRPALLRAIIVAVGTIAIVMLLT